MKNKIIILGLMAIMFIVGSSGIVNVIAEPNGTPFIQAEIDAIIEIIQSIQDQLDNIQVTWTNLSDIPAGFADDVDNDTLMEISTSCTVDQIVKWDGTQWNCATSASNEEGGEVALRKLDCFILRDAYFKTKWTNFQDGCDLRDLDLPIYTDLSNTNLSFAFLTNTDFDVTNMANVNLSYADLTDSEFDEAILTGVDFTRANLSNVEFYNSDITGAIFTEAYANPPCYGIAICADLPLTPQF